jgi:uncharacterized protein Smg (DUF494 family)
MQERLNKLLKILIDEIFDTSETPNQSVEEISAKLLKQGYSQIEIHKALELLLINLDDPKIQDYQSQKSPKTLAIRFLEPEEQQFISAEAYGYLVSLQELRLLDPLQVEQVLERSFMTGAEKIKVEDLRKIVMQTLIGKELKSFETDAIFHPGNNEVN